MRSSSKPAVIMSNCSNRPCRILHNLLTAVPLTRTAFLPNSNSNHNTTIPRNHHNRIIGITLPVHQHLRNHSIRRRAVHNHFISFLLPSSSKPANKDRSSARLLSRLQAKMIFTLRRRKGQILQGVWERDRRLCMVRCQELEEEVVVVVEVEAVWYRSLRRVAWRLQP